MTLIILVTQLQSQSNSRTGRCSPWNSVKNSASTAPKAWTKQGTKTREHARETREFTSDGITPRKVFGCAAWSLTHVVYFRAPCSSPCYYCTWRLDFKNEHRNKHTEIFGVHRAGPQSGPHKDSDSHGPQGRCIFPSYELTQSLR